MTDTLRERAHAVTTATGFFADVAWSELLEEVSGVPRLQLTALLTRRPPGELPSSPTSADLADVLHGYRDAIVAAGGDTDRFDARLDELRALDSVTPAAAPEETPEPPEVTPAAPVVQPPEVVTTPAPAPDRQGPRAQTVGTYQKPTATKTTAKTPAKGAQPTVPIRIVRAVAVLVAAYVLANAWLGDSVVTNWLTLVVFLVVTTVVALTKRTPRMMRIALTSLPGAMVTVSAIAWREELLPVGFGLLLGLGVVLSFCYLVLAFTVSWHDPRKRRRFT